LRQCHAAYCNLTPPPRSTIAIAFSPDGALLASTQCALRPRPQMSAGLAVTTLPHSELASLGLCFVGAACLWRRWPAPGAWCDTACSAPRPVAPNSHMSLACAARSFATAPATVERPQRNTNTCGSCQVALHRRRSNRLILRRAQRRSHGEAGVLPDGRVRARADRPPAHALGRALPPAQQRAAGVRVAGLRGAPRGALRWVCVAAGGRLHPLCKCCACGAAPCVCITDCAAVSRSPARRAAVLRPSSGPAQARARTAQVRLWDVPSGVCLATHSFQKPIASLAFHCNGAHRLLAVASGHKARARARACSVRSRRDSTSRRSVLALKHIRALLGVLRMLRNTSPAVSAARRRGVCEARGHWGARRYTVRVPAVTCAGARAAVHVGV